MIYKIGINDTVRDMTPEEIEQYENDIAEFTEAEESQNV